MWTLHPAWEHLFYIRLYSVANNVLYTNCLVLKMCSAFKKHKSFTNRHFYQHNRPTAYTTVQIIITKESVKQPVKS